MARRRTDRSAEAGQSHRQSNIWWWRCWGNLPLALLPNRLFWVLLPNCCHTHALRMALVHHANWRKHLYDSFANSRSKDLAVWPSRHSLKPTVPAEVGTCEWAIKI